LCGQKSRPPGFAAPTPSEVAAGDSTSALLKKTFVRDSYEMDENDNGDENGTPEDDKEAGSEVSFNDELNLSDCGREDQSSMALGDAKNIGGGKLLSWGTGY